MNGAETAWTKRLLVSRGNEWVAVLDRPRALVFAEGQSIPLQGPCREARLIIGPSRFPETFGKKYELTIDASGIRKRVLDKTEEESALGR